MFASKVRGWAAFGTVVLVMMFGMVFGSVADQADASGKNINFKMVPSSAGISQCLPKATAEVTVQSQRNNQKLTIKVKHLAPNADYDFFVTQVPHGPFGISWYQSDLHTNRD